MVIKFWNKNMTTEIQVKITQEMIEKIIKESVEKDLQSKLKSQYFIENVVTNIVINKIKDVDFKKDVLNLIETYLKKPDSIIHSIISRQLEDWLKTNKYFVSDKIYFIAKSLLQSKQTFDYYIEPLVTKAIVEDPNFSTYLKGQVSTRLNEKLKSVTKTIADNTLTPLISEFIKEYKDNRFNNDNKKF